MERRSSPVYISTASTVTAMRGMDEAIDEIAVRAIKEATWKPGQVNNNPVRSRLVFPVVSCFPDRTPIFKSCC